MRPLRGDEAQTHVCNTKNTESIRKSFKSLHHPLSVAGWLRGTRLITCFPYTSTQTEVLKWIKKGNRSYLCKTTLSFPQMVFTIIISVTARRHRKCRNQWDRENLQRTHTNKIKISQYLIKSFIQILNRFTNHKKKKKNEEKKIYQVIVKISTCAYQGRL